MTKTQRTRRWPYFPGQAYLVLAGLLLLLGTVLPWAFILGKLLWASPVALMWTFWAAVVTLAAAVAPWRRVVAFSAFAGGATGLVFGVWQTAKILDVCALSLACLPGPGLGVLLSGGLLAAHRAVRIAQWAPSA